jgi:hypothetical protein
LLRRSSHDAVCLDHFPQEAMRRKAFGASKGWRIDTGTLATEYFIQIE